MAKRPHFGDEPKSRLAVWSSRFGWFALAVAAMSVIIVRSGLLEVEPSLATFAASLAFAVLAILFAFGAFIVIWRQGLDGLGRALLGLFLGGALLAYPAYLGYRALKLPALADVTTDFNNPPRFDTLARLRPRGTNDYQAGKFAPLQRQAYPDLSPLQVELPARNAYDIALDVITKRKWVILDARAPAPPARREGTIEAVSRTPIMGFREDVVIRVGAQGSGARIDIRSASRYTFHDIGSNAARVRALLDDIDEAISNAPDPRVEPERPEPQRRQPPQRREQERRRQPANSR